MSLIVSMSSKRPAKSNITLIQELRKFLNNEIYPYIKDEYSSEKIQDFLEDEAEKIKKHFDEKADEEDYQWWKKWGNK